MTVAAVRPTPAQPAFSRRETLFAVLMLVGVTFAAYANTFRVPFIFDDYLSIGENSTLRSFATAWAPPSGDGLTVSGRPLLNLSLALNWAISGEAVWSYHLVNLLIHVAAGGVLFDAVRRTLLRPRLAGRFGTDAMLIAAVAALLWLLHPLQTESVTYIIQRAESLAALMYLLTLWFFIRAMEPGASPRWLAAAWGCCLVGMTAKETMVSAPVMVLLYDRLFVAESWRELWERRRTFYFALVLSWALLAWLIIETGGRGGSVGFSGRVTLDAYALTQVGAIIHYLGLVFWPNGLAIDYGTGVVAGWQEVAWQGVLLLLLVGVTGWGLRRLRPAAYLGVLFFALLAPTSSFVPVQTQTMSEHRMYLPLAAVTVLVAAGLYRLAGRRGLLIGGLAGLALGSVTIARNQTYQTEIGIWEDVVAKRPGNARAWTILGTLYERADRLSEAQATLEHAVQLDPRNAEAQNNLGDVWLKLREWDQAIACYRRALELKPGQAQIMSNLGMALHQAGRVAEAVAQLEATLQAEPKLDSTRLYLAALLAKDGRLAEAAGHFALYVRARPGNADAHANYGNVLLALGRGPEGLREFETAVRLRPDDAVLHNNLGLALARAGRVADALPHFREAVRLKPDFTQAQRNAEHAAHSLGQR